MLNRLAGSGRVVEVSWRTRRALAAIDRAGRVTDGRFDASILGALERIGEHGARLDRPRASIGPAEPASDVDPATAAVPTADARPRRPAIARARAAGPRGHGRHRQGTRAALGVCAGPAVAASRGRAAARGGRRRRRRRHPARGWLAHRHRGSRRGRSPTPPRRWSWWSCGREPWRRRRSASGTGWRPTGGRVHHLVDPRTGEPARTGLIAVTVAAADPAWAEVWSKALFLAGRDGHRRPRPAPATSPRGGSRTRGVSA